MGETYYENAEFATARAIYRTLLDKYPGKSYTKLVALRLGDFLRDEGKEEEALKVYQQVITDAPQPIRLRGKLRMANIYANRPFGEDYKKGLTLYDEVIQEGRTDLIAQEARLRKGLTLTLHNQYREAIAALEALKKEFPDSPYVSPGTVEANIEENLKGLVDTLYQAKDDWEIAKVYNQYRDKYFRNFRFKATIFQIATAYHRLGLYDEALGLYGELMRPPAHSLTPLARYRNAQALADRDDLGRAEEGLLAFIQDYESNEYRSDARMLLGEIYTRARRYQDARNAYRLIVQDFEKNPGGALGEAAAEAYYRLGQLYKELGQITEAEESFAKAIENFHHPIQGALVPEFIIRSAFLIGDVRFELNRDPEALQAYRDAIAKYPDHERTPWAWYQIGLIQRRNGEDVKALETFNTLVEMAKKRPGEMWEGLAKDNQRELTDVLKYKDYLNQ
jgi:TolA-binding protein